MYEQSIRTNILTIFLLLLGLVSISLLVSQYYFNTKLAKNSIDKTFDLITTNLTQHLKRNNNRIVNILKSNLKNKNLFEEISFDSNHISLHDLTQIMSKYKGIHALYFAHKDGSFYEILDMQQSPTLYDLYRAPKETRWTNIISIKGKTKYSFLDKNDVLISSYTLDKEYSPLTRPWYIGAIGSDDFIMTEPYKFANLNESGITYAIELKQEGTVLSIDYTLKVLSHFLKLQKFDENSEIFLFNKEGNKVASSDDTAKVPSKIHPKLEKSILKNKNEIIKYTQENKNYFSSYSKIKSNNLFLGIKVDTHNLLEPYNDNMKYSFSISFLLLLLSIPIIFISVRKIVKPIEALIVENEKIKNREFNKVSNVQTNIVEFHELSTSFVSMSKSIQDYQKSQEELLNSIIKLIAEAIDAKSPYTGGHCKRVPEIAQMLVAKASASKRQKREFLKSSDLRVKMNSESLR